METGDSRDLGILLSNVYLCRKLFYIFYLLDTVLGTGDTWYAYIAVVLLRNDGGLDKVVAIELERKKCDIFLDIFDSTWWWIR